MSMFDGRQLLPVKSKESDPEHHGTDITYLRVDASYFWLGLDVE